ncbi:acetyltransferase, GNAT family [Bacillus sp. JCM 19046]|nr:acetyltransferase, GNAT family [Bacillus sp. JCM 19045]GAF15724.1 acetyltransferase, GNAT family [Bacillus sp. JCM 19046]
MYTDKELTIRPVKEKDLPRLWELIFKEENPEWKQWDAPYFPHHTKTLAAFLAKKEQWIDDDHCWLIEVNDVVGTVSCYYEDAQKRWLEMGIGFYEGKSWGKGLGTRALILWMNHLFQTMPLVRVGLTTWSGNYRMVRVAEKLGMTMEGRMRKVRFYNGTHYDSIRMGILREEWASQYATN